MQEPNRIRYYITTSGEEPTVRSVRVALGSGEPRDESEANASTPEASHGKRLDTAPTKVKLRVKDAIRRSVDR